MHNGVPLRRSKAMERKKVVKALRFCVIGLVLLTIVLFILSLYTLFSGLVGAISGDTLGLELNKNTPTGDWELTLEANPRNNGVLGLRLFINLGILNSSGEYIVVNSTSVYIAPGGQSPFSLTLTIPYEVVQKYLEGEQGAPVVFEMMFGIRTLGDLVGFTQIMRIVGEVKL